MSFKVKPSSQFTADLRAILTFISADDVSSARCVQFELNKKITLLKSRPLALRLRAELGEDLRVIRVFNYLLIYRVNENIVLLDRLVHSSQDLETIFKNNDKS